MQRVSGELKIGEESARERERKKTNMRRREMVLRKENMEAMAMSVAKEKGLNNGNCGLFRSIFIDKATPLLVLMYTFNSKCLLSIEF